MAYLKWGFLAAVITFIISLGLGIIFGVGMSHIIFRAIVFAFIFFGIGFGLSFAVNNLFPELLSVQDNYSEPETYEQQTGSRVNITLDTKGKYAVPELYKTQGNPDELGNIEDLISGYFKPEPEGIDRTSEESYNQKREFDSVDSFQGVPEAEDLSFGNVPVSEKHGADKTAFSPSFGDNSEGLGGLPDLDAMATAFFPTGDRPSEMFSTGESQGDIFGVASSNDVNTERGYIGSKPQPLKGDFDPKELAKGISTVLNKDK